jgi:hypothetical protein
MSKLVFFSFEEKFEWNEAFAVFAQIFAERGENGLEEIDNVAPKTIVNRAN